MPRTALVTLLYLALVGLIAWTIVTYVPMPGPMAMLVVIAAVVIGIILLLRLLPPA